MAEVNRDWTALVGFIHQEVPFVVHRDSYRLLEEELAGRAPVLKFSDGLLHSISFGLEGKDQQSAVVAAQDIVIGALGKTGISWLEMGVVMVEDNAIIDQDIDRINPVTGRMRPEADTLKFPGT